MTKSITRTAVSTLRRVQEFEEVCVMMMSGLGVVEHGFEMLF